MSAFTPADAAKLKPLSLPVVPRRTAGPTNFASLISPDARRALAIMREQLDNGDVDEIPAR